MMRANRMKSLTLLAAACGRLLLSHASASSSAPDAGGFVIAGYLPDYRAYIDVNATAAHLTDLMLFSLTPGSVLRYADDPSSSPPAGSCCLSPDHYRKVREARSHKSERQPDERLRLLLTIGGGGRSEGFGDIVTGSKETQRQFGKGLVQLCRDEGLDGIDMDFEGMRSQEEWKAYVPFLVRAAKYLHDHGLLLTVALHPGQWLPKEVCGRLDRVHVMTYDMPSPRRGSGGAGGRPNYHASLSTVREVIAKFTERGCSPSKLVVGIPAYGRHGREAGLVRTYSEIVDDIVKGDEDLDAGAIGESLRSTQSWGEYEFDSPDDVRAKVEYTSRADLGGVFLWELGQDKQMKGVGEGGVLLGAAASAAATARVSSRDEL